MKNEGSDSDCDSRDSEDFIESDLQDEDSDATEEDSDDSDDIGKSSVMIVRFTDINWCINAG